MLMSFLSQYLNLSSISSLRSSDLAGLMPTFEDDEPSALQTLMLNNTGVDDEVAALHFMLSGTCDIGTCRDENNQ